MATVTGTLKLFDAMTRPLQKITNAMNMTIASMDRMEKAMNVDVGISKTLAAAQREIAAAGAEIRTAINQSNGSQQNFNRSVKQTSISMDGLIGKVFALNEMIQLGAQAWYAVKGFMDYSDEIVNANARLAAVNDGLETQAQLQQKILDIANRSYAPYNDIANFYAKMNMYAAKAFKDQQQTLRFTELYSKALSGAPISEQASAIQQMTQALASGVLRGDEFNSIMENAAPAAQAIARGLNVSVGALRKMAEEGKLTTDVVVESMLKGSSIIENAFNAMPMTFGRALTIMGNMTGQWIAKLNQAEGPINRIIQKMNELQSFMQSAEGIKFFDNFTRGVELMAYGVIAAGTIIAKTIAFMGENWSWLEPIILAVASASVVWTAQTIALAGAWLFLNTAMKANVIILIISLLVALGVWLYNTWKTNDQFAAAFLNAWNSILGFFDQVPIFFAKVGFGIVNAFNDAANKVLGIVQNLINNVISGINQLVQTINGIAGTSFEAIGQIDIATRYKLNSDAFRNASDQVVARLESAALQNKLRREQRTYQYLQQRAATRGTSSPGVMNALNGPGIAFTPWGGEGMPNINKVGEVGKIRDKVDISSEDLRIMRELAEQQSIQNFVTLQPNLTFGDMHVKQEGRTVQEIIAAINQGLEEEIASSARMVLNV